MLRRSPSPERREYIIQPDALTDESREVLLFLLKYFAHRGVGKFENTSYTFSNDGLNGLKVPAVLASYTEIRLTHSLFIRRLGLPSDNESFPTDCAIDVYSGRQLELNLGTSCVLDEVIGTIEFSQCNFQFEFNPMVFYVINPLALTDGTKLLLDKILALDFSQNHEPIKFISPSDLFNFKNLELDVEGAPADFLIQICQTLLRKPCSKVPPNLIEQVTHNDFHYFIYSTERVGTGAFSVVSAIPAKLFRTKTGDLQLKHYEENEQWVGKAQRQSILNQTPKESVESEFRFTELAEEPKAKPPIYIDSNTTSIIMMRMIPGDTLQAIIERDRKIHSHTDRKPQSIDQRLKMIVSALKKYLKQIQAKHFLTGDLKSTNVKFTKNGFATFFDFGLAREADSKKPPKGGTLLFAAPEFFENAPLTLKSEIFSFAWMVFEILGGEVKPTYLRGNRETAKQISQNISCNFYAELEKSPILQALQAHHKDTILKLVQRMFSPYPKERPSFEETLNKFETILFERRHHRGAKDFPLLEQAFKKGSDLRRKLYDFSQKNTEIHLDNVEKLTKIFFDSIENLADEKNVLIEFIESADLLFLLPVDKKANLMNEVHQIISQFKDNYGHLKKFECQIEDKLAKKNIDPEKKISLNKLQYLVAKLFKGLNKRPTIDTIKILNSKFQKNLEYIEAEMSSSDEYTTQYRYGVFTRRLKTNFILNASEVDYSTGVVSQQADSAKSHIHVVPQIKINPPTKSLLSTAGLLFSGNEQDEMPKTIHIDAVQKLHISSHNEDKSEQQIVHQAP